MSSVISDAPASNAEVFQQYHYYVRSLIARYGFDQQFVEDMASIIFTKWIEKDVLSDYDPTKKWESYGKVRTANFQTFLSGFVIQYLYHYKTREDRRASIECESVDFELPQADGSQAPWLDAQPEGVTNDLQSVEMVELVLDIEKYLHGVKPTRHCSMEDFFAAVMRQVTAYGRVNIASLADEFNVSRSSIQNWLKLLREHIKEARA